MKGLGAGFGRERNGHGQRREKLRFGGIFSIFGVILDEMRYFRNKNKLDYFLKYQGDLFVR